MTVARNTSLKIENGRALAEALSSRARLLAQSEPGHSELPKSLAAQNAIRTFISLHALTDTSRL
jgi:hypothetical protein